MTTLVNLIIVISAAGLLLLYARDAWLAWRKPKLKNSKSFLSEFMSFGSPRRAPRDLDFTRLLTHHRFDGPGADARDRMHAALRPHFKSPLRNPKS